MMPPRFARQAGGQQLLEILRRNFAISVAFSILLINLWPADAAPQTTDPDTDYETYEYDQEAVDFERVLTLIDRYGCLDRAMAEASTYVEQGCNALAEFPDSPEKTALLDVAYFTIDRAY